MFERIHVDRTAERGFRRRAQHAYPVEYMETLWGRVRGGAIYVYVFMPIEHTGEAWKKDRPAALWYEDEDLDEQQEEAREHRLECLGTIHSHPDNLDSIFSEGDLREIQGTTDCLMGICAITRQVSKGRTRKVCQVEYWPSPRPMEVVYGKKRAGKR
jgi:proteasome lid subunit RPN8/RPN11